MHQQQPDYQQCIPSGLKDPYCLICLSSVFSFPVWQDRIFNFLPALYGIIAVSALVQLIRIEIRVPEYGATTQKVFHFLNFLVNAVRCVIFYFSGNIQLLTPEIARHMLLDLPSLVFFTTYALLILFWAEIYYQARSYSVDRLRPTFIKINGIVYAIQISLWLMTWWKPIHILMIFSKVFFAGVSLCVAFGFLAYGSRLIVMLKRFPIQSAGRIRKLQEVGRTATICFSCFLLRFILACFAFNESDVLEHPVQSFIYYLLVEILPFSLVLFILRKLPPRRVAVE